MFVVTDLLSWFKLGEKIVKPPKTQKPKAN